MPKCSEVARELRELANHLEAFGDCSVSKPMFQFKHLGSDKDGFLAAVGVLPRPLKKDYGDPKDPYAFMRITHDTDALTIQAITMRSTVCKIVEPAKPAVYRCEPLLSEAEDAAISEGVQ